MKAIIAILMSVMMISGGAFAKGKKKHKKPKASAPISSEVSPTVTETPKK